MIANLSGPTIQQLGASPADSLNQDALQCGPLQHRKRRLGKAGFQEAKLLLVEVILRCRYTAVRSIKPQAGAICVAGPFEAYIPQAGAAAQLSVGDTGFKKQISS